MFQKFFPLIIPATFFAFSIALAWSDMLLSAALVLAGAVFSTAVVLVFLILPHIMVTTSGDRRVNWTWMHQCLFRFLVGTMIISGIAFFLLTGLNVFLGP